MFVGRRDAWMVSILVGLTGIMFTVFVTFSMWVWTKIGTCLVMKSSRSTEFEADQFSWKLGYGEDLCILLYLIDGSDAKGLFAHLASSHPRSIIELRSFRNLEPQIQGSTGKSKHEFNVDRLRASLKNVAMKRESEKT
jgi:heat shock protein HtpX